MKKTPLQQLIEEISGMKALLNNQDTLVAKSMDVIKNRATELLEEERKEIVRAYNEGVVDERLDEQNSRNYYLSRYEQ